MANYYQQYIDFSQIEIDDVLDEPLLGSGGDGQLIFPKESSTSVSYDDDMSAFLTAPKYKDMIKDAFSKNYSDPVMSTEKENMVILEFHSQKYYVCFLKIDEYHDIYGLIDKETEEYIFVGQTGSHEFVYTKDICFSASDGSSNLPSVEDGDIRHTSTILLLLSSCFEAILVKFT